MKKKWLIVLLVLSASVALAASMSVQVRQGVIRATPSQLGRVVATVPYGTVVQTQSPQKDWVPVTTADGKKGWLHASALSTKPVSMQAGSRDVATGVSSDEVSLAGKGFNEQVEAKLKSDGTLDYTWVDRMEAFVVDADRILMFRQQGQLPGGEL